MTAADYRQHFLAGIEFLGEVDCRSDRKAIALERDFVASFDLGEDRASNRAVITMAAQMAREWLRPHDPWRVIGRRCHDFSHGFHRLWRDKAGGALMQLWVTVGEVRYRGESVYGIDRAKIDECVRSGLGADKPVGVHVWLTFEDMSILDLTIMASLLRLGRVSPDQYMRMPVVCGRPEELEGLEFIPYLVDDDFRERVGR
jgi:hypothetical protein